MARLRIDSFKLAKVMPYQMLAVSKYVLLNYKTSVALATLSNKDASSLLSICSIFNLDLDTSEIQFQ